MVLLLLIVALGVVTGVADAIHGPGRRHPAAIGHRHPPVRGKALQDGVEPSCEKERRLLGADRVEIISFESPPFQLAVFAERDIVSNDLRQSRQWEAKTLHFLTQQLEFAGSKASFLDIGANVGWFAFYMAALGHSVIAVEAMQVNFNLLKYSLCLNPPLRDRLTLHCVAVGERSAVCRAKSPLGNRGNGNMDCSSDRSQRLRLQNWTHWDPHGMTEHEEADVRMVPLDDLLPDARVDVLKIDVEGYEHHALLGGRKLLSRVGAIHTEFSPFMLRVQHSDPIQYLVFLRGAGFRLFLGTSEITDFPSFVADLDRTPDRIVDLRAVRKARGLESYSGELPRDKCLLYEAGCRDPPGHGGLFPG